MTGIGRKPPAGEQAEIALKSGSESNKPPFRTGFHWAGCESSLLRIVREKTRIILGMLVFLIIRFVIVPSCAKL